MKLKIKTNKNKLKIENFDAFVKDLQQNNQGCCSDKNVCDIRCSPLYSGDGCDGGGCC